ncbi:MFS monocarboxylate transporter, putative [Penicillium digitatum]|uniref:MFS monocarboxylate transporter, putative n=3 Tax=Penicillium digitatum TaxID=36651 RepID=K9FQJ3_PEND2|nr:MFS monocarboxylate transporter, putative [Penicillium digitatum Pd1]EKV11424.1 MFS monocarboxylate transporter, putative [Penicillium digitatum PHI26]EKV20099.1 MFS monocarboxylate transporter, putative [Penicillium digitatum Pd1]KAG0153355.1 hypothetical protein PDIDSM_5208 [Penicillium digitatum]QQK39560.1 MFS monocarboxylate transporter, putative [Penicillium digitatum]
MRLRIQPKVKCKLYWSSALKALEKLACTTFTIVMFMGFLGFCNLLFYVTSYAIEAGIVDSNLGFYLLSILKAASNLGRIVPNFLAEKLGPLNVLTPAAPITTVLALIWIRFHIVPGLIIFAVFYSFVLGGVVSLPPMVMASITPDVQNLGMVFVVTFIGPLIATPIGGAILADTNKVLGAQLLTACCLIVSAVLVTCVRFLRLDPNFHVRALALAVSC